MLGSLETSPFAAWVRESVWGWPLWLSVHVIGTAVVIGFVIIVNLRLLGLFGPKMALITIGAAAVLYFSVSDRIWGLKAGEDAPMVAKWVAGFVLLAWTGVLVCGRLLPYI